MVERKIDRRELQPFTLRHFMRWAGEFPLDSGELWKPEPFQQAFIEDVFAGHKVCWLIVPEGNGKTTLVAGLGNYMIDFMPDAYVPVAASTRDQAIWIFRQAAGFLRRAERTTTFKILSGHRRIEHAGAVLQVFAADAGGGDGIIPGGYCFIDELHRHQTLDLYRTWIGKLWKRDAQLIVISTAGEAGGEFEEERDRFRQTADEITQDGAFTRAVNTKSDSVLHEWALEDSADLDDLEAVKRANPFSGVTLAYLAEKRELPGMTAQHWARFTCNRASRGEDAAIQESEWFAAALSDGEWPLGEPVYLGLDIGWKWDTTSAVPLFVSEPGYRLLGPATVLIPPRDGTSLDPYKVENALHGLYDRNPFHTVIMDTSRAEQLAEWISTTFGVTVIDRQQTNEKAVQDYERFTEALREGWLRHTGDPMLTRHTLNAVARVLPKGDARFDRPHKSRTSSTKQESRVIDALTAAAMAHSVAHEELTMAGGLVY